MYAKSCNMILQCYPLFFIPVLLAGTPLEASSGTLGGEGVGCRVGFIYEGVGNLPQIVINLPGPIRICIVKKNHISLAVRKILWYRQTDQRDILLLLFYYIGLGRLTGHFQYSTGYWILKLSRYWISGWFLMPNIWLSGRISGNVPDIERCPNIRPDIRH